MGNCRRHKKDKKHKGGVLDLQVYSIDKQVDLREQVDSRGQGDLLIYLCIGVIIYLLLTVNGFSIKDLFGNTGPRRGLVDYNRGEFWMNFVMFIIIVGIGLRSLELIFGFSLYNIFNKYFM